MNERICQPILLDSVEKVKEFVKYTSKFVGDIYVISGRYRVDGRSIMGVFSLNLSQPVRVDFGTENEELANMTIKKFYVRSV